MSARSLALLTITIDRLCADAAIAPSMASALDALRQMAGEAADDMHRMSHRLRSSTPDYQGLVPALAKLAAEFSSRRGISSDFVHTSIRATLPSASGETTHARAPTREPPSASRCEPAPERGQRLRGSITQAGHAISAGEANTQGHRRTAFQGATHPRSSSVGGKGRERAIW